MIKSVVKTLSTILIVIYLVVYQIRNNFVERKKKRMYIKFFFLFLILIESLKKNFFRFCIHLFIRIVIKFRRRLQIAILGLI